MAKKMTLKDHEKRVTKEEDALLTLQGKMEDLEQDYKQKKAQLQEKIDQQKIRVTEAESSRNLCLLEESGFDYHQLKAEILNRSGGGSHV